MRGKAKLAVESSACCRITPAYAGKRIPYFAACFTISDHPRLCGEKIRMPEKYPIILGSPPPMRGKGPDCFGDCTHNGITPAYAGKRSVYRLRTGQG